MARERKMASADVVFLNNADARETFAATTSADGSIANDVMRNTAEYDFAAEVFAHAQPPGSAPHIGFFGTVYTGGTGYARSCDGDAGRIVEATSGPE